MPRNIERDEKEAMRRKEQLMEAGFRLFSQYGIENVSLQRVADAAEVGVATLCQCPVQIKYACFIHCVPP